MQDLTIVYDGECPICTNYSRMVKIDDNLGPVTLVDARLSSEVRQDLTEQQYDLDQGMVVRFKNRIYFGADAINFLSQVNTRSDFFNQFCFLLFHSKTVSSILYPAMRAARNLLLWVMNVPKINNLNKKPRNA